MLSPQLTGLWIPTSCISANYKVPSTKPDVTHPPLFQGRCLWRGRIIQTVTFYTGFVVTERSICKPREALNKYLANLKACVLHAKGLSSSYDSFCFLVINTVLIALAITTATCLTASVSENAEAHLKLSLPPRVYAYAKKPVANNSHSQACDSYLQKLFDTLASHARYNYHFLVHRTKINLNISSLLWDLNPAPHFPLVENAFPKTKGLYQSSVWQVACPANILEQVLQSEGRLNWEDIVLFVLNLDRSMSLKTALKTRAISTLR